jgi:hypothetical protein
MLVFELTFDSHRSLAQYRGRTGRMPDDFDHEVIDSPQALFRHLYEAHGVVEALDLDPATAPLQFWLRRHSELERATTRAAAGDRAPAAPVPGAPGASVPGASGPGTRGAPPERLRTWDAAGAATAAPRPTSRGNRTAGPHGEAGTRTAGPRGEAGTGSGPRFRPFADPLVEALATALVGRGMDERQVRRGLSTFTGADGRHGEEAVRAAFVAPMLEAVAAHLTGAPPNGAQRPPSTATGPGGTVGGGVPPRAPVGQERTAREPTPEREPREATAVGAGSPAAEHETWVAQPLAARASAPEPDADFMAIADVLQERRRSRRGGRRDGPAPPVPTPPPTRPPAATPTAREPDDDVMALADALQRRRTRTAPH